MDELGKAITKLDRRIRDIEKLHKAVELYLKVDPYRLLHGVVNLDKLPPEKRRKLLVEARTLLRYINSESGVHVNPGLEDNLLLLAWLLILFPEPFLSDAAGLGVIGLWLLIKKAKGEQIDLSTIKYSLKRGMEMLKKH